MAIDARKLAATCLLAAFAATPALANGGGHENAPRTGATSLNLEVVGHIPQRCGLGRLEDVNLPSLGGAISVTEHMGLVCNVPFDLTIRAQHGALTNERMPGGQGGFAGKVGYDMTVSMPVRKPGLQLISANFHGEDLRQGQQISSQDGVAFDGAVLRVDLRPVAQPGLLAGDYSETISVSISPRI